MGLAAAVLTVPTPTAFVEQYYATAFPVWQRALTGAFDASPIAPFDIWVGVVLLVAAAVGRRSWRRAEPGAARRAAALLGALVVLASLLYLWFVATWGLNYRRDPLATRLRAAPERVTPEAVLALAERTVSELNRLHPLAASQPWPDWRDLPAMLAPALAPAARSLGLSPPRPGRPRVSLFQPYFRWASIEGMTDPFLLDVIVNGDLLPMERPSMVAHEWGHLAGLARESDASYFAWRLCQRGDVRAQYSAWLFIYGYVLSGVAPDVRLPILQKLAEGPRRDLRAIAARSATAVPAVRDAAWLAYDRYLKTNRVPEGITSYDEVVVLILGTTAYEERAP